MRPSYLLAACFAAVHAAPAFPSLELGEDVDAALTEISKYWNLIASKIKEVGHLGSQPCDVSQAHMPSSGLAPPSPGLTVRHVAVGRGTQNYTCSSPSSAPKAAGAVATLFNATCVAALHPQILSFIPRVAVYFRLDNVERLAFTSMTRSGRHYFTDGTTPFFDLDTPNEAIGKVPCAKNSSVDAPTTAAKGQKHDAAVPWLKLDAREAATGGIKEVYRVDTAGGSPPATCEGMPEQFQVPYSAVYWFW